MLRDQRLEMRRRLEDAVVSPNALALQVFSPFDILWCGLAVVTAYKIGVCTYTTED